MRPLTETWFWSSVAPIPPSKARTALAALQFVESISPPTIKLEESEENPRIEIAICGRCNENFTFRVHKDRRYSKPKYCLRCLKR